MAEGLRGLVKTEVLILKSFRMEIKICLDIGVTNSADDDGGDDDDGFTITIKYGHVAEGLRGLVKTEGLILKSFRMENKICLDIGVTYSADDDDNADVFTISIKYGHVAEGLRGLVKTEHNRSH